MPQITAEPPRRILIVKPSSLGDVVHALPFLHLLRKKWPAARIEWLIMPAFADLLDGHPDLDAVIRFERGRFGRGWMKSAIVRDFFSFTRTLREKKFDLVIDLQGLFRSGWLTWQTHAPIRVGMGDAREVSHAFYTHRVAVHSAGLHAVDRYLAVADALELGTQPVEFKFHVTEDDRQSVDEMLGSAGPFAVLLPGTNWATKRWPAESFAALVKPLREQFGLESIVAGSDDAKPLARIIQAGHDFTCKTSIRQLIALIERSSLVIANDSGPMHIACGLGKPMVAIFGPTNPNRTGPYGRMDCVLRLDMPCSPCYSRECSHHSCMKWLDVEVVLRLAGKQLETVTA